MIVVNTPPAHFTAVLLCWTATFARGGLRYKDENCRCLYKQNITVQIGQGIFEHLACIARGGLFFLRRRRSLLYTIGLHIKRQGFRRIHIGIYCLKRYLFAPCFVKNARKTLRVFLRFSPRRAHKYSLLRRFAVFGKQETPEILGYLRSF